MDASRVNGCALTFRATGYEGASAVLNKRESVAGWSPAFQRGRGKEAARPAIVHVSSHPRHRQSVFTEMIFASVSTALLLQNGHTVGRATGSFNCDSNIIPLFLLVGAYGRLDARCSASHCGLIQPSFASLSRADRVLPMRTMAPRITTTAVVSIVSTQRPFGCLPSSGNDG
jgi:hypothetical protein